MEKQAELGNLQCGSGVGERVGFHILMGFLWAGVLVGPGLVEPCYHVPYSAVKSVVAYVIDSRESSHPEKASTTSPIPARDTPESFISTRPHNSNMSQPSLAGYIIKRPWLRKMMMPVANWYANAAGYRKLGLKYVHLHWAGDSDGDGFEASLRYG